METTRRCALKFESDDALASVTYILQFKPPALDLSFLLCSISTADLPLICDDESVDFQFGLPGKER